MNIQVCGVCWQLNNVVKKGETKSHDKIDESNYDETSDFPKESVLVGCYQV